MAGAPLVYASDTAMNRPNVYPLQTFLEIQRLMRALGLSPADCLSILLDALLSIQDAERLREDAQGCPFPLWLYGHVD